MRSLVLCWSVFALVASFAAADSLDERGGALEALEAALDVEQSLLTESLNQYQRLVLHRDELAGRLLGLQEALDAAVGDEKAAESGRLDVLIEQVQRVEGERALLFETERGILGRISEGRKRIALLNLQVEALEGRVQEEQTGALTGTWIIVLMPVEQRGTWKLKQAGAVVEGTYELSGGYSGSLQGTLVDRKVYLERIDSKLGKMMEFEGYLSRDGQRIRGTWLNYEISGAEGGTGQWTAERQVAEP